MSAESATLLRDAARQIETRGWQQDSIRGADGRVCMVGGIYAALGVDLSEEFVSLSPAQRDLAAEVQHAIELHLGVDFAPDWNDAEGRTQAEVVKELLTVADLEDVR
jgi:hypothetical protein